MIHICKFPSHVSDFYSLLWYLVLIITVFFKGVCFGESFGIKVCLHGIRPHPTVNHLSLVYSPMEYRLRVLPVSKRSSQISLKIVHKTLEKKQRRKSSLWTVTVSNKAAGIEKKIVVTGIIDWMEMNADVEVTHSEMRELEFTKLCLNLISRTDRLLFIASFDEKCRYKNLKVSLIWFLIARFLVIFLLTQMSYKINFHNIF